MILARKKDSRLPIKYNPRIVIDHHPESDISKNKDVFVRVDPEVGAATTLIYEIMLSFGFEIEDKLATIMAVGIDNDNKGFKIPVDRKRDRHAWVQLTDRYIPSLYAELSRPNLPTRYYKLLGHAIKEESWQEFSEPEMFLVTETPLINSEETSYLAKYADILSECKKWETVIVWAPLKRGESRQIQADFGTFEKGFEIKVRSTDKSKDLNDVIRKIFQSGGAKVDFGIGEGAASIYVPVLRAPTEKTGKTARDDFRECLIRNIKEVSKVIDSPEEEPKEQPPSNNSTST